jgi:hypothetical protein
MRVVVPWPDRLPVASRGRLEVLHCASGRRAVNRAERLRAALDGTGMQDQAASLAALPAAQVSLIVAALKASGRAALARDRDRRRQRVADRRRYGHVEDHQQAEATERQTLALARRAGSSLETLARLQQFYADGPAVLALAVAGLRARGYTDGEIGQALGVTRAAVGQRFGRKGDLYAGPAGTPSSDRQGG